MWSIGGIEIIRRLNGELLINVSSDARRALLVDLLRRMLNPGDFEDLPGQIVLKRGTFLYTARPSGTGLLVYIPYSMGKSYYGLYIDDDVFMLMGDAENIDQQREREILNKLNELSERSTQEAFGPPFFGLVHSTRPPLAKL